jgi:hypothetical protein
MRGMGEKDSEIGRLKIEVDNQRGQLERAKEMAGIKFMAKVTFVQSSCPSSWKNRLRAVNTGSGT